MTLRAFIPAELRPYVSTHCMPDKAATPIDASSIERADLLIIASQTDRTAGHFYDICTQTNDLRVFFLKIENLIQSYDLLFTKNRISPLLKCPRIFVRLMETRDPELSGILGVVRDILAFHPGVVINRPNQYGLNHSKLLQTWAIGQYQSQAVQAVPTSVANRQDATDHVLGPDRKIIKSISYIRSLVVALDDPRIRGREQNIMMPIQFQPCLEGQNIRVHVCDNECVALKIHSKEVDYRYDADEIRVELTDLPKQVIEWCADVTRSEGLLLSGIDLILDSRKKKYYCFEINPAPGYSWYESKMIKRGHQPLISNMILDHFKRTKV